MKRPQRRKALLLCLPLLLSPVAAEAAPPRNFEARIEAVRKSAGAPGMAMAIVEDGKVVLARGFGVRKLGESGLVDADTVFMIGSTGKAMTAAALAILVDQGKLDWDDRVVDKLPDFQMYDAWVTREMRVRDLLVHRSGLGLGAGDLLYVPRGSIGRAELVRRLRYIKPASSFRSAYAYDNILYGVAGQLIEAVSGQSWEDYVREHLFAPAGMTSAITDDEHHFANPNRAFPHARVDGVVRGIGDVSVLDERDQLGRAAAPAGMIGASANDLARWLQIQLAQGALPEGGRLFSEASAKAMWEPVTPIPIGPPRKGLEGMEPQFQAYALGWEVRDYHGTKIVWHSGGLFGFTSIVVLIPEKKVGFAIVVNGEELAPRHGLMYELMDHYLGRKRGDWPARFAAWGEARTAEAVTAIQTKSAAPAKVGPSLSLARYAGTFADPWYGHIVIAPDDKGLAIDFKTTPGMRGRLEHWQYDSFIARFDDKGIEPAYVTFGLDAEGKIERITMKPVSPIADFSFDYADLLFTPVAAAQ